MPESADVAVGLRSAIADFDARFAVARVRLLRITGSLVGEIDAEDVVQDTYVTARRRLPQLRDPDALEAWLTAIAVNLAFSGHRRRRTLRELLPRLHRSQPVHRSPDLALRELVETLPPRERTVLVLHYGHGYRLQEIAELLDLTHTNVRTIIARTRRRLFTAWREADQ